MHVHVHAHAHVHVHAHMHVHVHAHGHVYCAGTCIRARLGAHVRRALRRVDSRGGAQLDGLVSRGAARVHRDDARLSQQSREMQGDEDMAPSGPRPGPRSGPRSGPGAAAPEERGGELWPPIVVRVLVCGAVRLGHHHAREAEPAAAEDGDALALPQSALRARRLGLGLRLRLQYG